MSICSVLLLLSVFNCSQTKFVAIILVFGLFVMRFFWLTDFSTDLFDFCPQKRDEKVAVGGH